MAWITIKYIRGHEWGDKIVPLSSASSSLECVYYYGKLLLRYIEFLTIVGIRRRNPKQLTSEVSLTLLSLTPRKLWLGLQLERMNWWLPRGNGLIVVFILNF